MAKIAVVALLLMLLPSYGRAELIPGTRAPEFPKEALWLSGQKLSLSGELKGKVVLIEFWEYTCINCIRTFPRLKELYSRYRPFGFEIVGVHKGEFGFASEVENAARAYKRFALPYPVIADVKDKLWKLYDSNGWPNSFLVDQQGVIRDVHHGEGGYGKIEKGIQDLLRQRNPAIDFSHLPIAPDKPLFGASCGLQTDEIFVGYLRGSRRSGTLANSEGFQREVAVVYKPTSRRVTGGFFAEGWWLNRADNFESVAGSKPKAPVSLGITYQARDVYAVLGNASKKPVEVWVTRDGQPIPEGLRGKDVRLDADGQTVMTVDDHRMYYVLSKEDDQNHELIFLPKQPGLEIYSFSFGNRCLEHFDRL